MIVALGLTALVGQTVDVSIFAVNMISAMGLALGIDYALFVVSRYREERRRGRDKLAAIEASGATSARALLRSNASVTQVLARALLWRMLEVNPAQHYELASPSSPCRASWVEHRDDRPSLRPPRRRQPSARQPSATDLACFGGFRGRPETLHPRNANPLMRRRVRCV